MTDDDAVFEMSALVMQATNGPFTTYVRPSLYGYKDKHMGTFASHYYLSLFLIFLFSVKKKRSN